MNRRRTRPTSRHAVRTDRVFGVASARSVQQRQRPQRASAVSAPQAAAGRVGAAIQEWVDHWAQRASNREAVGAGTGLIGLDVSRPPSRLRTGSWVPVVAAAIVGALFLAVLRMDVIRMRFSVAEAFKQEMRLEEEKRELTVDMRQLRDPAILGQRAEKLGFRRAERLIDLDKGSAGKRPSGPNTTPNTAPPGGEPIELAVARRPGARR